MSVDADALLQMGVKRPTHVKIDVDGIEPLIVEAFSRLWPDVRRAIIETDWNDERHIKAMDIMRRAGFSFSQEQADSARRKSGPNDGVGNVVWSRAGVS